MINIILSHNAKYSFKHITTTKHKIEGINIKDSVKYVKQMSDGVTLCDYELYFIAFSSPK
jgi:hypothetical protein